MKTAKLAYYLGSFLCLSLIIGLSHQTQAQQHEIGFTTIRTDAFTLDWDDRVFEPSLRYTFLRNNFGFRALYAWRNTNQQFGSGTAYPERSRDKMHYFSLGLQYGLNVKKFELYAIADLGYLKREYSTSSSNAKLYSGGASWGDVSTLSLRPGFGLKYRLFKQLHLGVEFQQQLNWNNEIGSWELYYFDPNPSIGRTTTNQGKVDRNYFSGLPMLSGLIISWRF